MEIISKHFPELTTHQYNQFTLLPELYQDWNSKINVLSRKDIESLLEKHVLHSLAIAKFIQFSPGTKILDIGTGGGFPGIPLAIFFPETEFLLVDSIGKKIKVVEEIKNACGLQNVRCINARAESVKEKFDFVVSRAVAEFSTLYNWSINKILNQNKNSLPNGIICLKGGDLTEELKLFEKQIQTVNLSDYFSEEFFTTKKLVYLPVSKK